MKLKFEYFENNIEFDEKRINVIELENKIVFYKLISELNDLGKMTDIIYFFDENNEEINCYNKIRIISDYFNLELNTRKNISDISKIISNNIDENDKLILSNEMNKLKNMYTKILNNADIVCPLIIEEINFEEVLKLFNLKIKISSDLLENLMLLIDLHNIFRTQNILIFINLKQYLNSVELEELYKYSIYNSVKIILIDSQSYGCSLKYEKKLIIDENMDEFVI